jgi:hypothetical protein
MMIILLVDATKVNDTPILLALTNNPKVTRTPGLKVGFDSERHPIILNRLINIY